MLSNRMQSCMREKRRENLSDSIPSTFFNYIFKSCNNLLTLFWPRYKYLVIFGDILETS